MCVCVFRGVNQLAADSELSYHYRSLALRVHLDWDRQFAASIEFRLYALSYIEYHLLMNESENKVFK